NLGSLALAEPAHLFLAPVRLTDLGRRDQVHVLSLRFVNEDLAALLTTAWDGNKQFPPIRNKEPSPRAGRRFDLIDARVVIRILLTEDIHESAAPDDVDAAAGGVIEQIIGVADNFERPGLLAGLGVDHQHPRRRPTTD